MNASNRMIGSALDISPSPEHAEALRQSAEHRQVVDNPLWRDGPEHVITGTRQEGKTRLAMGWLLDAPEGIKRVLVVESELSARDLKAQHGLRYNDKRIISWRQLLNGSAAKDTEYGIDETVSILTQMLRLPSQPHLLTICHAAPWQGTQTR